MRGSPTRRRTGVVLLLALWFAQTACEQAPAALQVGQVRYSEEELGALTTSQRERLALLTALGLVIAQERVAELTRPFVEAERNDQLLQRLTLEEAARIGGLDERALRAAYLADPEYELTVRHLVVLAERWRDESERAEARAKARGALDRIRAGEDFAAVAGAVSEEPGAQRDGGLLEPGRRGTWVPEFWNAASSLDVGAFSDVVETQYGYHVIQLTRRDTIPFDSVRYQALSRTLEVAAAVPAARQRLAREDEEALVRRALEQRIPIDSVALARIRSDVTARIANLAIVFGFEPGAEEEEVKVVAMEALADPRQSVRIALADLAGLATALEGMFEFRSAAGRPAD